MAEKKMSLLRALSPLCLYDSTVGVCYSKTGIRVLPEKGND